MRKKDEQITVQKFEQKRFDFSPLVKFWLIIYLFFLMYQPTIMPINNLHVCTLIACALLLIKGVRPQGERYFLYFYAVLFVLFAFTQAINKDLNLVNIYGQIFTVVELFLCAAYVICECKAHRFNVVDMLDMLIVVALLQSVLALFAFVDTDIQVKFLTLRLKNTDYNDVLMGHLAKHRMYGFCTSYTFAMPLFHGVMTIVALYLYLAEGHIWRLAVTVPIVFAGLINARNIVTILLVGFVIVVLFGIRAKYSWKRVIITVVSAVLLFFVLIKGMEFIEKTNPKTYKWLMDGIEEIKMFLKGENEGYFSYLARKIKLGEITDAEFMFGIGRFIMGNPYNGYESDVGFVNYIYFGGIVYSWVLYAGILSVLIFNALKGKHSQFLSLILLAAFVLGNIKGMVFGNNEIMTLFCLAHIARLNLSEGSHERELVKRNYSRL